MLKFHFGKLLLTKLTTFLYFTDLQICTATRQNTQQELCDKRTPTRVHHLNQSKYWDRMKGTPGQRGLQYIYALITRGRALGQNFRATCQRPSIVRRISDPSSPTSHTNLKPAKIIVFDGRPPGRAHRVLSHFTILPK